MKVSILLISILVFVPEHLWSQSHIEDLFLPHVGIFTRPIASWFYYRPDTTIEKFYIVTAKHVLLKDSLGNVYKALNTRDAYGHESGFVLKMPDSIVFFPPDSLLDLMFVDHSLVLPIELQRYVGKGFHDSDIMSWKEVLQLLKGHHVFYVGMEPDSLLANEKTRNNPVFSVVQSELVDVPAVPFIVTNNRMKFCSKVELILSGSARPGQSGSPVLIVQTDTTGKERIRLLGVVNGYFLDGSRKGCTYCSLAYHLKEFSATRPKMVKD